MSYPPESPFGDDVVTHALEMWFRDWTDFEANDYHPLAWIKGDVSIGRDCYIGFFAVVHGVGAPVVIGNGCDIAPHAVIDVADSHRKAIGLADEVEREGIMIARDVFVGAHAVICPGVAVSQHSVIGAGEVVREDVPPYSLVVDGEVKRGYYEEAHDG